MDTEKWRQLRHDGARLTESGNFRSEQLLVVPTESLTNKQWLLGELLSGSERQRPGWFLDRKYQTCLVNPWCACAVRVTVLGLCVCVSVCLSPVILALQGPSQLISDTNGSSATRARKVMWRFCLKGGIREIWR